jgi:hypothetical protein
MTGVSPTRIRECHDFEFCVKGENADVNIGDKS